jgi:hypothetical protein
MSLTYPQPPGIDIFCRAGKLSRSNTPIFPGYNNVPVFAKDQIRIENKKKPTLSTGQDIAGNGDHTDQRFVIRQFIKSGINLFQNKNNEN